PAFTGGSCVHDNAAVVQGNAEIDGNLTITGTCTGCAAAVMAVNGSNASIHRGDAVTLLGATTVGKRAVVVVAAARAGQAVIGVADSELVPRSVAGRTFSASRLRGLGRISQRSTTETRYFLGGATIRPGSFVRVV